MGQISRLKIFLNINWAVDSLTCLQVQEVVIEEVDQVINLFKNYLYSTSFIGHTVLCDGSIGTKRYFYEGVWYVTLSHVN